MLFRSVKHGSARICMTLGAAIVFLFLMMFRGRFRLRGRRGKCGQ